MTALPTVTTDGRVSPMPSNDELRRMELDAVRRPWRTPRLPELVGSVEACAILKVQKMTLHRWMAVGSGALGPDRTYMIPPKRIAAGPVWVKEDVERFAEEIGRQRAPMKPRSQKAKGPQKAKRTRRAKNA